MKFKLETGKDIIPTYVLKDGWWKINDYDQYIDVERGLFKVYEHSQVNNSLTLEQQETTDMTMKVTFVRKVGVNDSPFDFYRAYMTFGLNRPDGNHEDPCFQIELTVEQALAICCEEK